MNIELLEAFMLLCWGASWPFSIAKSLQTRSVEGKSTLFLTLILCGYVAAITAQFIRGLSPIVLLYFLNASMVFTDLCLVLHFRHTKSQTSTFRLNLKGDSRQTKKSERQMKITWIPSEANYTF